jgi:fucose permease
MEGKLTGRSRWLITCGAFISMSFLGMSRTFLGTALPAIRVSLHLNLVEAGTFPACLQFGFSAAVFVGGFLSDIFKKKTMLMLGCLSMGTTLLVFGFSPWFAVNLIAMAVVGIGGGLIEASSDPLLIELFPGRESIFMNLHHFFFAFGSLMGPVIVGALLARAIPWEWGYIGFGLFVMVIFFFFVFQKSPGPAATRKYSRKSVEGIFRERSFWILFLVTFCSMGVQNGIVFWMVTFLEETRGFPVGVASVSLSAFFVCMALGRLLTGYLITKVRDATYLLSSFSFIMVSLYLCVTTTGRWAILFLGICGLVQSGVFPVLMALTGKLNPERPGTAMGFVATGAGLGAMSVPWLMALVSQLTSLQTGFFFLEIFLISCLVLMGSHLRYFRAAAWRSTS